jgi:hypothetical protein
MDAHLMPEACSLLLRVPMRSRPIGWTLWDMAHGGVVF